MDGQVGQRQGQVGFVGGRVDGSKSPVGADGFLDRGKSLWPPVSGRQPNGQAGQGGRQVGFVGGGVEGSQPTGQVGQGGRQVGFVGGGVGGGQLPTDGDGFLDRG